MPLKKEASLATAGAVRNPFALLKRMAADFDRMFEEPMWSAFAFPGARITDVGEPAAWLPEIDVFQRDNRLVTKIDLPGMKKEDVKVEVTDGHLAIFGERKRDAEEKKRDFYRREREYGSFYRAVPLPEGVKLEDVKATFADGVLEVSIPMPARPEAKVRRVEIVEPAKGGKSAA